MGSFRKAGPTKKETFMRSRFSGFFFLFCLLFPVSARAGDMSPQTAGTFSRVFMVLFENTNYSDAMAQPHFKAFAKGGALLTNYLAIGHPSEPNYIAMTAGSTFGITDDNVRTLSDSNIADLLEPNGKTWKAYAEDINQSISCNPQKRANDPNYGHFLDRHVPFLTFKDINDNNKNRCIDHVVDATELQADIKNNRLPDYSFYTPNALNDGHDTGVAYADTWFGNTIMPLLKQSNFMTGTLVIVLFDESANDPNHVYFAMQGSMVVPGSQTGVKYTHYNLLRTIENGLKVGNLGRNDKNAAPILGVWK
jgi:phospholipase C